MADPPAETPSPFHPGEVALQTSLSVAQKMEKFGRRVIRDFMPDQHRDFYGKLPFIVLGAVDDTGDPWATLLAGSPGFMHSPDPRRLDFAVTLDPRDPASAGLGEGAAVGLLGIELHTRRRNRMNGRVHSSGPGRLAVSVEHAFGNCPQYIQLRDWKIVRDPADHAGLPEAEGIDPANDARAHAMIASADTFFVASYIDDGIRRHVDASHRGGKPGFVKINDDGSLTIPDFAGNLHFNTLGNFLLNPRAGLIFPNFATGDVLQLTGDVQVVLDSPDIAAFQGAERLWTFRPRRAVLREGALPLRFAFRPEGWSPNSLMTGDWEQARNRLAADKLRKVWRPFRIAKITEESSVIRSLHLEPADGTGIVAHRPGQHLPIRVQSDSSTEPAIRTYTISTAPSDGFYRISVKRQGAVSEYLHRLKEGDLIEARAPAGNFTIDPLATRPAVLMAAGVGITPILAMLRSVVFEGLRKRSIRRTFVFFSARNRTERAFDAELADLMGKGQQAVRLVRVLDDTDGAQVWADYEAKGRIDADLLRRVLPFDAYDFYLCGPPPFMQGLYDQLIAIGVPDARIHAEAFGSASLKRKHSESAAPLVPAAAEAVPVTFMASGKEARWTPIAGSLLELAEAHGLAPSFGCRSGSCGTCATKVLAGTVTYAVRPSAETARDHTLICCAVPAAPEAGSAGRLVLEL